MRKIPKILIAVGSALLPLTAYAGSGVTLTNPLGVDDAKLLILRILRYSLGLLGIAGLIMIIYGGFLMLTSAGNADTIKKAKGTILWAAAGIAIILLSWSIIQYIFKTLNIVSNA